MSSLLVSFHFDVPDLIIKDIFEEQDIVSFKKRTKDTLVTYQEIDGVVSRYAIEAPIRMLSDLEENFANLPEVRSIYFCEDSKSPRRRR
ncbi:MAG: hypothetical protein DWQ19_09865 [Crenarchaeota archaeon]|nr:MAG: hypothetical protein DWQ19_09865 [Thermoproteota archaeon]